MYYAYVRSTNGKRVRYIEATSIRELWVMAYRLTRFWRKKGGVTFRIYDGSDERSKYRRYRVESEV